MSYTKQEIYNKIDEASTNMSLFYKKSFINYRGKTTDTEELYSEVVAEYLLHNIKLLDRIKTITRVSSYQTQQHNGKTALAHSNREEERIAMKMFGKSFNFIGQVLDYQIPLKNKRSDSGVGKIDLFSIKDDTAYILELKKPDSTETMLRCVLEGYTYLKTVDQRKLLIDFKLPDKTKIKAAPLTFYDRVQFDEYKNGHPNLLKLMDALDCQPFFLYDCLGSYDIRTV